MTYTFNNRRPTNVTIWAVPFVWEEWGTDVSVFAQDQWTLGRATLNLGLRYNEVKNSTGGYTLPAGPFVPERPIPLFENVPHWKNVNPRVGLAYDVFGSGRTAFKVSLGRYTPQVRSTNAAAPAVSVSPSTTRSWNDTNGNYVPDCALLNPAAERRMRTVEQPRVRDEPGAEQECARMRLKASTFSHTTGRRRRPSSTSCAPGMALNVGYFRTWYGAFQATRNLAVNPATDYDEFCITAPVDSRLPNSGERLCGLYDIKPAKFGQVDNLVTQLSNFGTRSQVYNGVDVTTTVRFGRGGQVSGGLSVGRMVDDNCVVVNSPQDVRPGFCKIAPTWGSGTQVKLMAIHRLPWAFESSVIYQNFSGIENNPTITVSNAAIAPSLGRNLSSCGAAAVCNQNVTIDLVPAGTMYEPRIQQVDIRVGRLFQIRSLQNSREFRRREPVQRQRCAQRAAGVRRQLPECDSDHGRPPDEGGRPVRFLIS